MPELNFNIDWEEEWFRVFGHRCEVSESGCWLWAGAINENGYGVITMRYGSGRVHRRPHRVSYQLKFGVIPSGLVLDHFCHDPKACKGGRSCIHRKCINPDHLRLSTQRENVLRGAMGLRWWEKSNTQICCPWGHEFTEENTYYYRERRFCKECSSIRVRLHRGKPIDRYGRSVEQISAVP